MELFKKQGYKELSLGVAGVFAPGGVFSVKVLGAAALGIAVINTIQSLPCAS